MTTLRQRRGSAAEEVAVEYLRRLDWLVVGRNVKVGRDEIDVITIDPGPPAELVFVEVRSATSALFGPPEERVDRLKVARLYRAMHGVPPGVGAGLARRVDLVVVDRRGRQQIRHLRRLEAP